MAQFENIQKIIFNTNFNQEINNFPPNIKELGLGYNFNQSINFPDGLRVLFLNCNVQSIVDNCLNSIE